MTLDLTILDRQVAAGEIKVWYAWQTATFNAWDWDWGTTDRTEAIERMRNDAEITEILIIDETRSEAFCIGVIDRDETACR